jgi:hypothetical protein
MNRFARRANIPTEWKTIKMHGIPSLHLGYFCRRALPCTKIEVCSGRHQLELTSCSQKVFEGIFEVKRLEGVSLMCADLAAVGLVLSAATF